MLRSYLTVALRTFSRNKAYTLINVIGLAIGLACCTVILLYLQREFSYDRHHEKADRIYRAFQLNRQPNGETTSHYGSPAPLGPAMVESFPEVEQATRFINRGVSVGIPGGEPLKARVTVADTAFFKVFDYSLLRGDLETGLHEPYSIYVTQSFARSLFGDSDPLGRTVDLSSKLFDDRYTITGILSDPIPTSNGDFQAELISKTYPAEVIRRLEQWGGFPIHRTYVQLKPGAAIQKIETGLPGLVDRRTGRDISESVRYAFMALTDLHLHANKKYGDAGMFKGDIDGCYAVGSVGLLIVSVVCINFVNLSTARSAQRALEVGMRKVVGARRRQLIYQFLGESVFLSLFSLALAFGIAVLALPTVNTYVAGTLRLSLEALPGLIVLALAVGLLAGAYPAMFLSSLRPIQVLKGGLHARNSQAIVRRGLVVVQFGVSIALVVATLAVSRQMDHVRNANLGFNKEALVLLTSNVGARAPLLKARLDQLPDVRKATVSDIHLSNLVPGTRGINLRGTGSSTPVRADFMLTGLDFLSTHEIPLAEGRRFASHDYPEGGGRSYYQARTVIVNQTAAKALNVGIGDRVEEEGHFTEVVGIIQDFHHQSLHHAISPLALVPIVRPTQAWMTVRVNTDRLDTVLADLESNWKALVEDRPFGFHFMDEALQARYMKEEELGRIITFSSGMAISIACLGLLGLVAYTAEGRTKEFGIRKSLGATDRSIAGLLVREFVLLVGVSSVLVWPIAYYAMNGWLDGFAYRIQLTLPLFLLGSGVALAVTLVTISRQVWRASCAHPIDALRHE